MRVSNYTTFEDGAEAMGYAHDNEGTVAHFEESQRIYGYIGINWYFIMHWNGEKYMLCSAIPGKRHKKDTDKVRRSYKAVCAGELRRVAEKYNGKKIPGDEEPLTIPSFDLFIRG